MFVISRDRIWSWKSWSTSFSTISCFSAKINFFQVFEQKSTFSRVSTLVLNFPPKWQLLQASKARRKQNKNLWDQLRDQLQLYLQDGLFYHKGELAQNLQRKCGLSIQENQSCEVLLQSLRMCLLLRAKKLFCAAEPISQKKTWRKLLIVNVLQLNLSLKYI